MAKKNFKNAKQKELKRFIEMVSKGGENSPVIVILPPLKGRRNLRIFKG